MSLCGSLSSPATTVLLRGSTVALELIRSEALSVQGESLSSATVGRIRCGALALLRSRLSQSSVIRCRSVRTRSVWCGSLHRLAAGGLDLFYNLWGVIMDLLHMHLSLLENHDQINRKSTNLC